MVAFTLRTWPGKFTRIINSPRFGLVTTIRWRSIWKVSLSATVPLTGHMMSCPASQMLSSISTLFQKVFIKTILTTDAFTFSMVQWNLMKQKEPRMIALPSGVRLKNSPKDWIGMIFTERKVVLVFRRRRMTFGAYHSKIHTTARLLWKMDEKRLTKEVTRFQTTLVDRWCILHYRRNLMTIFLVTPRPTISTSNQSKTSWKLMILFISTKTVLGWIAIT